MLGKWGYSPWGCSLSHEGNLDPRAGPTSIARPLRATAPRLPAQQPRDLSQTTAPREPRVQGSVCWADPSAGPPVRRGRGGGWSAGRGVCRWPSGPPRGMTSPAVSDGFGFNPEGRRRGLRSGDATCRGSWGASRRGGQGSGSVHLPRSPGDPERGSPAPSSSLFQTQGHQHLLRSPAPGGDPPPGPTQLLLRADLGVQGGLRHAGPRG